MGANRPRGCGIIVPLIARWQVLQQDLYRTQSGAFLRDARKYLAEGNLYQASEKGWGAAAQMVKAVAERRGWEHKHHSSIADAISRIHAETNDPEYATLYSGANSLHSNFYEGNLSQAIVALHIAQVELLLDKLARFLP